MRLSILIPARNEERNLPRLLYSLKTAGYDPFEIIVVDDASTDRTAAVAHAHGARVITARSLPAGWTGKTWACHQAALAAKGDTFLFLDADTFFEKDGLSRLVARYAHRVHQPLSLLPYHRVEKFFEQFSYFFQVAMACGVVGDHQLVGPCILLSKAHYQLCGGHEAVKAEVLENLFMSKRLLAIGARPFCGFGQGVLSIRMYPEGWRQMNEGWLKAFARGSKQVSKPRVTLVMLIMLTAWTGFINTGIVTLFHPRFWPWVFISYGTVAICLFAIARRLGSFRPLAFVVYPLLLLYFQFIFMRSWRRARRGDSAIWKGRRVPEVTS